MHPSLLGRPALRRSRRALVAIVTLALLAPTASAVADPAHPSREDVERSRRTVERTADQVGAVEARLARADVRLEALNASVARAVEAYNGARVRLAEARAAARDARGRAQAAQADVEVARQELGRFAAASYRMGGDFAAVAAFLSADGPQTLVDQANTIGLISDQHRRGFDRVHVTEVVAGILVQQAARAVDARAEAAAEVRAAKERAEAKVAGQQRRITQITEHRAALVAVLAAARNRTASLERARRQWVAEQRRQAAAEAAAAAAAAAAARRPQRSSAASTAPAPEPSSPPAPPTGGSAEGTVAGAQQAIAYARAQIGKPYEWAADGPDSFDCSGLTMMAWRQAGVYLDHYSVFQYQRSQPIALGAIRPGDLVFFADDKSDSNTIYHMGLYIGSGQMIEAPYTGENVRISSIYRDSLFGAARP